MAIKNKKRSYIYKKLNNINHQKKKINVSKYISLANTLSIFIVTIGIFSSYITYIQEEYQNRRTMFNYVDLLRRASAQLDKDWSEGSIIDRKELCSNFGGDISCENLDDTHKNKFKEFKILGSSSNSIKQVTYAAIEIPIHESASARNFVKIVRNDISDEKLEEEIKKISKVYFIDFPNHSDGWPAVLIKSNKGDKPWSYHMNDWSSLWFLRGGGHGMRFGKPPQLDWAPNLPTQLFKDLIEFSFSNFRVTEERIDKEILVTASDISGKIYTNSTINDAYQVVLSRPSIEVSISGLPSNPKLISLILPVLFLYSSLIFRSCVRTITNEGATKDEPWLLLRPETLLEKLTSVIWYVAICSSGLGVLAAFVVNDFEASHSYLGLMYDLTKDNIYNMRFSKDLGFYFGPKGNLTFPVAITIVIIFGIYACIHAVMSIIFFEAKSGTNRELVVCGYNGIKLPLKRLFDTASEFLECRKSKRRAVSLAVTSALFSSGLYAAYRYKSYREESEFERAIQELNDLNKHLRSDKPYSNINNRSFDILNYVIDETDQRWFTIFLILTVLLFVYYFMRFIALSLGRHIVK